MQVGRRLGGRDWPFTTGRPFGRRPRPASAGPQRPREALEARLADLPRERLDPGVRGIDVRREDAIEPLAKQMQEVFSTYVMDQQRNAHHQAMDIGSSSSSGRSSGGGGSRPGAGATMPAAPAKSSNVELF